MSAFEMLAFFRFIKFYNEGEITMVSVRKRGKVYEYRFEIATVEGTRKWITKSGYPTKAEAFKEGAKAYNDFYYNGQKTQLRENMSYADFLDQNKKILPGNEFLLVHTPVCLSLSLYPHKVILLFFLFFLIRKTPQMIMEMYFSFSSVFTRRSPPVF